MKLTRFKAALIVSLGVVVAVSALLLWPREPRLDVQVIGKTRAELHALMGEPNGRAFTGWEEVFLLGDDGTYFPIDNKWLGVRFEGERVVAAKVFVD